MRYFLLFLFPTLFCLAARADDIGDISADSSAIYTGNTSHGYAEIRVDLQNRSHDRAHTVTLVYPDRSYGYGNNIRRLARTVTLAPESLQVVSLLQPPLPAQGDDAIRVEVDDGREGTIHAPNANNHCNAYSSDPIPTVFISRSLNDNAIEHLFHANQAAFTPSMAVGAPDTTGMGPQPTTWVPDSRRFDTNWLEVDYATPQAASKILVYDTQSQPPTTSGSVTLIGVEGTNIAVIPMSAGTSTRNGAGWISEYDFAVTARPVKTVRLNFGKTPPYTLAIDAVAISGQSGTQWASDARASSDNSAQATSYGTPANPDSVESLRSESPISEWSENWLAYTPFDGIVLGTADMSSMSPAVYNAIGNYLYAGGNIVLFGTSDLPSAWHSWDKRRLADGVEYRVGFGRCLIFSSENPASLDRETVETLHNTMREAAAYWQTLPADNGAAEGALPIHGNLKVPVRGIVLVMLAFIVVIGPVNLIMLNRRKRRIWRLWTIPAISFATTLLVFMYSLLREGITPDARICGLTLLDQASHHASTFGGESFYCPLTPGGGLHFEYETEVTPLVRINGYGSGNARDVDWTQAQQLGRGWVSARVPAYFHLRKSGTARERIDVDNNNGTLQIVNGLGAPIKSLWIADADMNYYEATNVAAGQKTVLTLGPKLPYGREKTGPEGLKRDLGFGVNVTDNLANTAQSYLRPNTYIAVLDGNPFVENALNPGSNTNGKHLKIQSVVFGIMEAPGTK